jgi:CubicO group peptidase (beta-lactamase class C family)
MPNRISAAIGAIAVMCVFHGSANARPQPAAKAEDKAVAIERLVQSEMTARGIPGAQLTIVQRGKIVFTGAYGHANVEAATPVTKQTLFPINSISKAVAGVAAMQLVEAGKLDLDAPFTTYLDGLPEAWKGITVRQLLTHVSGLPEIVDDNVRWRDGAEPAAAWAKVQELPLKFTPGTKFEYTQTNYVVIGKIVERLTGKPYTVFVRDRQFSPVGMKQTSFASTANVQPHAAQLYTHVTLRVEDMKTVGVERSKVPFVRHEPFSEYVYPAGGIQTTSTDLAKWAIAVQKLKLVDKNSVEQLWRPQVLADGTTRGLNATINGYGLGWPSIRRAEHAPITLTGGARATVFIYPNDDLTVVVLTNLMGAGPEKFVDKIAALYIPDMTAAK